WPTQTWIGPVGDSTTRMPRSTPITRPVTTAKSLGWLDADAEGSAGDAGAAPPVAGTMSTPWTDIAPWTRSPGAKPWVAPAATQACSGPRWESTDNRPDGSTAVTVPDTVCWSMGPRGTADSAGAGVIVVATSAGGASCPRIVAV